MRCAVCGSKRVTVETKKEGYNTKKGIFGSILFGTPGAIIGGASGNETKYYHCADCGQVLNQPMDSGTQMNISVYMENPKVFEKELKEAKERYPNIEWTPSKQENSDKTDEEIIIGTMLELGRPVTIKEIVAHNPLLNSHQVVARILTEMRQNNQVKREQIGTNAYFSLIRDGENDIKWTPPKQENSRKTTKDTAEELKEIILEVLKDLGKPVTVSEIVEHKKIAEKNSLEFSSRPRITAKLIQLMDDNKVKREQVGTKYYFSLIK